MLKRLFPLLLISLLLIPPALAQEDKSIFRDTLDQKLDMSRFMIDMHGFMPVPMILSEPAIGNFGIALAAVFMTPKKSAKAGQGFKFPDITAGMGMYTANKSWGAGAFRQGSFPKIGLRYMAAGFYGNINMEFFRQTQRLGELNYLFEMQPILGLLDVSANIYRNRIFGGFRYLFTKMNVAYDAPNVIDTVFDNTEFNKDVNLGTLGLYAELDYRNSMFTPDKGLRLKTTYTIGRAFTGSDEDIDKFDIYANYFFQPVKKWVFGLRSQWTIVNDDVPFYYYPFLDMRGIPLYRYQGQQTLLFETEHRFDLDTRWSLVGFVGSGRTYSDKKFMEDDSWHWAGGAGFRYLVARLFKLRMGLDVARGPDQWAYYIVFGHYWNR